MAPTMPTVFGVQGMVATSSPSSFADPNFATRALASSQSGALIWNVHQASSCQYEQPNVFHVRPNSSTKG